MPIQLGPVCVLGLGTRARWWGCEFDVAVDVHEFLLEVPRSCGDEFEGGDVEFEYGAVEVTPAWRGFLGGELEEAGNRHPCGFVVQER